MSQLIYHGHMIQLLGRDPVLSPSALDSIAEFEDRCSTSLPASVREWYSVDGLQDVLDDADDANAILKLDSFLEAWGHAQSHDEDSIVFWESYKQNTGYEAVMMIDGSDDPMVVETCYDPTHRYPFSHLTLHYLWWRLVHEDTVIEIGSVDQSGWRPFIAECGPIQLRFLADHFNEIPRTRSESRFYRDGQRIEVKTEGDPANEVRPAGYVLAADTDELLFDLFEFVSPITGRTDAFCNEPDLYDLFRKRFRDSSLFVPPIR